jgi:hypothetical protein
VFIAEGGSLLRLAGASWSELIAPIGQLSAVAGRSATDLFVAGEHGAAHYDGSSFRCLRAIPGPLTAIARVGTDLWFGGDAGVYRTSLTP